MGLPCIKHFWIRPNSVFSFVLGLMLRLMCGEASFGLDPVIVFGKIQSSTHLDSDGCELNKFQTGDVPFRTIVMVITLVFHFLVSTLTHYLFVEEKISLRYDFFDCFHKR